MGIGASESDGSLAAYKAELDQFSVNFAAIVDQPLILPKTHKVLAHHWRGDQLEALLARSLSRLRIVLIVPEKANRNLGIIESAGAIAVRRDLSSRVIRN